MKYKDKLEWLNTFREDDITCPYCGYIDHDSWELEESGNYECGDCGEEFYVEKEIDVKYTSSKL